MMVEAPIGSTVGSSSFAPRPLRASLTRLSDHRRARTSRGRTLAEGESRSPALLRLAADVGGDLAVVWQFVDDYLALLDHRIELVVESVAARSAERAEVALLSLESTSLMVGADLIVEAVGPIRSALVRADFTGARAELDPLRYAVAEDRLLLERAVAGR